MISEANLEAWQNTKLRSPAEIELTIVRSEWYWSLCTPRKSLSNLAVCRLRRMPAPSVESESEAVIADCQNVQYA
jgi:hypothetical protein